MNPKSLLRVAAAGYPQPETPSLISFEATMYQYTPFLTTCKDVSFTIEPIIVFADLGFVSDMLHFVNALTTNKSHKTVHLPQPVEAKRVSSLPFTAESLVINQISVTLFVRSNTQRPFRYPRNSRFLRLIPDITNGQIVLPAFEFVDCTMTQAYVNSEIVQPLIRAGINQGLKLLFKTDIFCPSTGTRSSNFARRTQRLLNGELQVIGQMGSSAILQGGETILNAASKLLHFVSLDQGSQVVRVNATAGQTALSGAKAIGQGFLRGITGIVMDPIQGGRERGAAGVFLGIGTGLIGLVTRPIAGILDGGVGALSALRKLVNSEDDDVIPPIRIARAFPYSQIAVVDMEAGQTVAANVRLVDAAQFAIRMSNDERWRERIELFCHDVEAHAWIAITKVAIYQLDRELSLQEVWNIKDVQSLSCDLSHVSWKTSNGKMKAIVICDEQMAKELLSLVTVRLSSLAALE
jgi:hypothetical protein